MPAAKKPAAKKPAAKKMAAQKVATQMRQPVTGGTKPRMTDADARKVLRQAINKVFKANQDYYVRRGPQSLINVLGDTVSEGNVPDVIGRRRFERMADKVAENVWFSYAEKNLGYPKTKKKK